MSTPLLHNPVTPQARLWRGLCIRPYQHAPPQPNSLRNPLHPLSTPPTSPDQAQKQEKEKAKLSNFLVKFHGHYGTYLLTEHMDSTHASAEAIESTLAVLKSHARWKKALKQLIWFYYAFLVVWTWFVFVFFPQSGEAVVKLVRRGVRGYRCGQGGE
ncbi:hypothetical protein BU26DRAFT_563025 [Trematosphaeria pertusa]|uniref:Uncharacterized protein n=1 Tax=Trematosphaeria pertusa TaxID=390896 RepID=A0A6A6IKX2_9PLEO|nr:uncharacterized protein BU26DRAFT_563025 [Trematosphaeria pertusa]KAF2251071.1 hypothetical protein BU26DRAFT_563025 [Trematosphaeria pertusa]